MVVRIYKKLNKINKLHYYHLLMNGALPGSPGVRRALAYNRHPLRLAMPS